MDSLAKMMAQWAVAGFMVGIVAAIFLGLYWLIWQLWCYVLPSLWPDGPASLLHPDFWPFAGAWLLLMLVFGRRGK